MVDKLASGVQAPAELFIWTDIDPNYEDDFNQWYEQEHMLERASIPGFVWARRYRALQSPRKYLALYRTEQLAVFDSPAYQEAFTHQTQWSVQNFERMHNTVRRVMVVTPTSQTVGTGSAVALVALSDEAQALAAAQWMQGQSFTGVVSTRILNPDPQRSTPLPSESAEGRVLQPFFLIEATTPEAVTQAAQQLAQALDLAAESVATFELLWGLRSADLSDSL
ncbi:MAG TPA: hypothetical protein VK049_05350 [Paenalcaligenes sp.]|nr:hypothetical protein [Paenalcaligenes sp.]